MLSIKRYREKLNFKTFIRSSPCELMAIFIYKLMPISYNFKLN